MHSRCALSFRLCLFLRLRSAASFRSDRIDSTNLHPKLFCKLTQSESRACVCVCVRAIGRVRDPLNDLLATAHNSCVDFHNKLIIAWPWHWLRCRTMDVCSSRRTNRIKFPWIVTQLLPNCVRIRMGYGSAAVCVRGVRHSVVLIIDSFRMMEVLRWRWWARRHTIAHVNVQYTRECHKIDIM